MWVLIDVLTGPPPQSLKSPPPGLSLNPRIEGHPELLPQSSPGQLVAPIETRPEGSCSDLKACSKGFQANFGRPRKGKRRDPVLSTSPSTLAPTHGSLSGPWRGDPNLVSVSVASWALAPKHRAMAIYPEVVGLDDHETSQDLSRFQKLVLRESMPSGKRPGDTPYNVAV